MVSLGRVLFSFLQSLGYSVVSLVGDFFFFFFFLSTFSAVSRKGDGGRRVEERERGSLTLLGWPIVLASLESGYLEKGNDDW